MEVSPDVATLIDDDNYHFGLLYSTIIYLSDGGLICTAVESGCFGGNYVKLNKLLERVGAG